MPVSPENVLFLNRGLSHVIGPPPHPGDPPGTDDPIGVSVQSEMRLTLTGTGLNPEAVDALPPLGEVARTVPRLRPAEFARPWTNRDLAVVGHPLGLAQLRWRPAAASADPPSPADFFRALVDTFAPAG